ncbi:hypothetical protein FACS1894170_09120 [Planctomycetales bacterium]|nr:hypothetical protein FACS1894170_09120 [Planctomycetales bacterium]
MLETIVLSILLIVNLAIVLSGLIAFIWCFFLRSRINELLEQNAKLQSDIRQLQRDVQPSKSSVPKVEKRPVESPPELSFQPVKPIQHERLAKPVPPVLHFAATQPQPVVRSEIPAKPKLDNESRDTQTLELWIGRKLLGWVAVIGFIASAALFIRYAIQSSWITPPIQVFGIAAFGLAFIGGGKYFWSIGWRRFSTMLSTAGIIIDFQAGYASFAFYKLLSLGSASVVMPLIVLGSFFLAWHYRSKLLGITAIVGGLAVPMLLSTGVDNYPQFFTYLFILNVGTVMLVNLLRRSPLGFIAFFGTQIELYLWYQQFYNPDKLGAVLLFQGAFYLVYLADTTLAALFPHTKKASPTWDDAVRAILSPILLFATVWYLLQHHDPLGDYLGLFGFIGAAWYALLAFCYARHIAGSDGGLSVYWKAAPSAATVIALAFVAVAIPLQFDANWLALGWLTVFAGLWYFGNRQDNETFLAMSVIFSLLGGARLFLDSVKHALETPYNNGIFDSSALTAIAAVGIVIAATVITDRYLKSAGGVSRRIDRQSLKNFNCAYGIIAYLFLAVIFTIELIIYFDCNKGFFNETLGAWGWSSLTGLWILFALILFEVGVLFRSITLRSVAVTGFWIVFLKMLCDFEPQYHFPEPIYNPLLFGLILASLILIGVAVQSRFARQWDEQERQRGGLLGLAGIGTLLVTLSISCYRFFACNTPSTSLIPIESLSILWTLYAAVLLVLGLSLRNFLLRTYGLVILFAALIKIATLELFQRPDDAMVVFNPLFNSYFLTPLVPIVAVMFAAVWMIRIMPVEDKAEQNGFNFVGVAGLLLLLALASVECYTYFDGCIERPDRQFITMVSLTVFWTALSILFFTLAYLFRSVVLRFISFGLLGLTLLKVLPLEVFCRPDYMVPFWNPYAVPLLFLAMTLIVVGRVSFLQFGEKNTGERETYRFFTFFGVIFLWGVLSLECFQSVRLLQGESNEFWRAQLGLSILWSVFAGVLIFVGFVWRSSVLRWMSILLFGTTLIKILLVDTAGVNELYRFGAVFVLAIILSLAAWAYQRFKPSF